MKKVTPTINTPEMAIKPRVDESYFDYNFEHLTKDPVALYGYLSLVHEEIVTYKCHRELHDDKITLKFFDPMLFPNMSLDSNFQDFFIISPQHTINLHHFVGLSYKVPSSTTDKIIKLLKEIVNLIKYQSTHYFASVDYNLNVLVFFKETHSTFGHHVSTSVEGFINDKQEIDDFEAKLPYNLDYIPTEYYNLMCSEVRLFRMY